jgi:hypothetical protein
VLTPFWLARGAAGVHEEQGILGGQRNRINLVPGEVAEHIVDDEIAALDKRRPGRGPPWIALPYQNLVERLPQLLGGLGSDVRVGLVIDHRSRSVVAVDGDQDRASRIHDAIGAGLAAESTEDLGVDDAKPRTREHGYGKLGRHRHVKRYPVARLEPGEVAEQRGKLVHPNVELLIRDGDGRLVLGLRHEVDGGLVLVLGQVTVDAIERGVDAATDEPLPTRRVAGIEGRMPIAVPAQEIGVLLEATGEVVEAEALEDLRVGEIRLGDEFRRRVHQLLFLPVHRDLRLAHLLGVVNLLLGHDGTSPSDTD